MTQDQFKLMVRILHCRDRHEFGDVFAGAEFNDKWMEFRDDPCHFFIHNSGDFVDQMWNIIQAEFNAQATKYYPHWAEREVYADGLGNTP